ncbi:hypothetical protein JTE90_003742 [Oedothorax gibbosus]|uniref:BTB domain-containing protein n=1 Tax=Oedothorax gibbosus TaxID=931172 RepID=A0AAV6VD07_9ARAC|nr:hypothetical protein JTE90_003742 [Oedothorax gibbosus]
MIAIVVQGEEFVVNKDKLKQESLFFRTLFEVRRRPTWYYKIPPTLCVTTDAFAAIAEYLGTGLLPSDCSHIRNVYKAAVYLDMPEVRHQCYTLSTYKIS